MPDLPARLAAIQARIAAATQASGRPRGSVRLVAVSKTHTAAAIGLAIAAGQGLFGENRVQEAARKFTGLRGPACRLHLIGPLQTNKARDAVALADMIQTLDRPSLADALARAADLACAQTPQFRPPDLLVQVNVGDEPQKSGVSRRDADAFIGACRARFGAQLRGLMCVPPAGPDPTPFFTWLAERAAAHGLAELSMGMSADFEAAIACGATMVRIGSAIFGDRPDPAALA